MHETISPDLFGDAGRSSTRWRTLVTSALIALAAVLSGCDDGDDGGPADAGADAPPLMVCRMSDCATIALPSLPCDNGGRVAATCARGTDNRCTWTQARCSVPTPDAAGDLVPQDGRGDGGAGDALDGGDASDAGDAAEAGIDAVADLGVGN